MPTAKLFVQPCCRVILLSKLWSESRTRHLEMERVQMMTRCQLTLTRKVKERVKVKNQHVKNRTTSTSSARARTGKPGHWVKDCWNPSGRANDNSTHRNTGKGKSKHTSKGESKYVNVVGAQQHQTSNLLKHPQPCGVPRKIRVLLDNSRSFKRGSWV